MRRDWLNRDKSAIGRLAGCEEGYSLPEVLVAALILVIGIGGLMSVFVSAGKGSQTSSRQDVAAIAATQELESMRSYPYASLALNSQVAALPDGRLIIGGTQFQATSKKAEDLVTPVAPCGTSITTSCSPFAAVSHGSMDGTPYTVYRVISWADQSCPTDLTSLSDAVSALYGAMNTVEATLNALNGAAGTQGSIASAQSHIQSLVGSLAGLPLLHQLLAAVQGLQNDLGQFGSLVSSSLPTGLQNELSAIQSDLTYLRSQSLIDGSGHVSVPSVDLCHLPKLTLPNGAQFRALATVLTDSTVGVETSLTSGQADVTAAAGYSIGTPVGDVTATDSSLSSDNGSIQAGIASSAALSPTAIGLVHDGLTNLKNLLNCADGVGGCLTGTHVTKRISVAVVLNPARAGVGPEQAVWMSSLVTDPSDGLL